MTVVSSLIKTSLEKEIAKHQIPFFGDLSNEQFKVDFSIVRANNDDSLEIK